MTTAPDLAPWLAERCEHLATLPSLAGERDLLRDIAAHAREPLRVAVTGDVSSGKSSLVNALLGRRVAEVRRAETTSAVSWYRAPSVSRPPALAPGHRSEVLDAALLRRFTVVDTPGVNTVSGNQRVTEAMLSASTATAGAVSVLVYLCAGEVTAQARRRIRSFSALTTGPLEEGVNVALCASKVDDRVGDDPERRAELVSTFRRAAGRYATHALALCPALAMASWEVTTEPRVLELLTTISRSARLHEAAGGGWGTLGRAAGDEAPEVAEGLGRLEELCGTAVGVDRAAAVLAEWPADPAAAVAACWRGLSGLDDLMELLDRLHEARDVLTVSSVRGRLRRLALRAGPALGAPVAAVVDESIRRPGAARHEWRAAALVLDGPTLDHVSVGERRAAAALLRGESGAGLDGPAVTRWQHRAEQPDRSSGARYVAGLVVSAALAARVPGGTVHV